MFRENIIQLGFILDSGIGKRILHKTIKTNVI